jgi:hypothetical protein
MHGHDTCGNKKAFRPEGPRLLAKNLNYFLALVSFFFVVSVDILLIVSGAILLVVSGAMVVVSGATVELVSLVLELSLLLLQAATDAAMIAIAKNFFIFEN